VLRWEPILHEGRAPEIRPHSNCHHNPLSVSVRGHPLKVHETVIESTLVAVFCFTFLILASTTLTVKVYVPLSLA
jgi:hypothetical protein